jgi:thioredoxin-like negative regulator of GroEL
MAPVVHGLEIEYWGKVNFVYLDIDSASVEPFEQQLGFRGQPHFLLLDGEGNIVEQFFGRVPEDTLRTSLDSLLDS